MKKGVVICVILWLLVMLCVNGKVPCINVKAQESEGKDTSGEITEDLLGDMDFTRVQSLLDDMLGKNSFSFSKAIKGLISGEEVFSKEAVQEFLHGLFFSRLEQEKGIFFRILLLVIIAAVFSNFASVFDSGQIGEVSFYMVYLLLFILIMDSPLEKNYMRKQW